MYIYASIKSQKSILCLSIFSSLSKYKIKYGQVNIAMITLVVTTLWCNILQAAVIKYCAYAILCRIILYDKNMKHSL